MADEPVVTPSPTPESTPTPPADLTPPKPLLGAESPKTETPSDETTKPVEAAKPPVEPTPFDIKALKVPEGVELPPEELSKFEPVAKELGLSQEQSQKLLDFHVQTIREGLEKAGAAPYKEWNDTQTKWQDAVKADPEIGGDKLEGVLASSAKVIDQYGTPGFRDALAFTGAGNNPEIIKTIYRMSKALTEGGHVAGSPPKGPPPTGAQALYPNLK